MVHFDRPLTPLAMQTTTRFVTVHQRPVPERFADAINRFRRLVAASFDKVCQCPATEAAAKQVGKDLPESLVRNELVSTEIQPGGLKVWPILDRSVDPFGKGRRDRFATVWTLAFLSLMLGYFYADGGQLKDLAFLASRTNAVGAGPGNKQVTDIKSLSTLRTNHPGTKMMYDDLVGVRDLEQRVSLVSGLAARSASGSGATAFRFR